MATGFSSAFSWPAFYADPAVEFRPPGAVGAGIVALLAADPVLAGLMPDGVWYGVAPAACRRFVLVTFVVAVDTSQFRARAFEDHVYTVTAISLSSAAGDVVTAAARIEELLDPVPGPSVLAVAGYRVMVSRRVAPIDEIAPDTADSSLRWSQLGGRYQVMVAPVSAPAAAARTH